MERRPNFRVPRSLTPKQFERIAGEYLRCMGALSRGRAPALGVVNREVFERPDGTFEIDVTVRFRVAGLDFLMLVECKHHRDPIKREVLQVLNDKLHSIGAHKGVVFATSGFQSGAIKYGQAHGIALIHCRPGEAPGVIIGGEGEELEVGVEPGPAIGAYDDWLFYWGGRALVGTHIQAAEALTEL